MSDLNSAAVTLERAEAEDPLPTRLQAEKS